MDDTHSKSSRPSSQNSRTNNPKAPELGQLEGRNQASVKSSRKPNSARNKNAKGRRRDRHGKKNDEFGVKLVLRLLPPNLSQDQFLDTIRPEVGELSDCGVLEWYYVRGHYSQNLTTRPVYSRCYLIFEGPDPLQRFAKKVQPVKFVDDKDNSTSVAIRVSPYVKRFVPSDVGSTRSASALEGTIAEDALFQTFMKSLKILEENKSDCSFADVSLLKPLDKELAKQKAIETEIQKKTESALVALTGDSGKKKKDKKKSKKKDSKPKEEASSESTSTRKRKGTKKAGKAAKSTGGAAKETAKNNNVVILEAAGRKELQRRKKLQMEKDKISEKPVKANDKPKQRSKGKSDDMKDVVPEDSASKLKLLKRKITEQS